MLYIDPKNNIIHYKYNMLDEGKKRHYFHFPSLKKRSPEVAQLASKKLCRCPIKGIGLISWFSNK